jgi:hypothetical protein
MRAVWLYAAFLVGCSNKSEQKPAPAPPPAPAEAPAGSATGAAAGSAAGSAAGTAAPSARVAFDCGAILTAADIQQVCNATVELKPSLYEGTSSLTKCSRTLRAPGAADSASQWALATFSDAAAIEAYFAQDTLTRRAPLAGVGDAAWTGDRELSATHTKYHDVVVRKGTTLIVVGNTRRTGGPTPPCTDAQLVELARLAIARVP